MIIRNNLDTAERVFYPRKKEVKKHMQYKWYDYMIVYTSLIVVGSGLFWLFVTISLIMFGDYNSPR